LVAVILEEVGLTGRAEEDQDISCTTQDLSLLGGLILLPIPPDNPLRLVEGVEDRHGDTRAVKGLSEGLDDAIITTGTSTRVPAPAETVTKTTPAMTMALPARTSSRWRFNQSTALAIAVNL
jgi:hypothetical protein